MSDLRNSILEMLNSRIDEKQDLLHSIRKTRFKGFAMAKGGAISKLKDEIAALEDSKTYAQSLSESELRDYARSLE